jgi:hypothetical protein
MTRLIVRPTFVVDSAMQWIAAEEAVRPRRTFMRIIRRVESEGNRNSRVIAVHATFAAVNS